MSERIVYLPVFPDNPDNPARCNRSTGVIEINQAVWSRLSPVQRRYWLEHERGHIRLRTPDEVSADRYAFGKTAGTVPYSLKSIRETMSKVTNNNQTRMSVNAIDSLQYSAANGGAYAKTMLAQSGVVKAPPAVATKPKTAAADATASSAAQKTAAVASKPATTAAVVVSPSQLPNTNPVIVEKTIDVPDTIYIDAPVIESVSKDESMSDDDRKFLETQETILTPMTGPQKAVEVSVGVKYDTPEETAAKAEASTAMFGIATEKTKSLAKTMLYGVIIVAVFAVLALFIINKNNK